MNRAGEWIWSVLLALVASPCCGADLSAEQVRAALLRSRPGNSRIYPGNPSKISI
ncbi:MAG TPA: hypothetical protein VHT00_01090 [Stellaceae bacterium]|nr:hypothetical protein [Stellaceae bacterium]HEX3416824.1 hypothetical protein [Stellaceae bacterium]